MEKDANLIFVEAVVDSLIGDVSQFLWQNKIVAVVEESPLGSTVEK